MKNSLPTRLSFTGWDWLNHHSFPIQLAGLVVVLVGCVLFVTPSTPENAIDSPSEWSGLGVLVVCCLGFAALVLRRQRRVLALQQYETRQDAEENRRRLLVLAKNEGWRVSVADSAHIRLHVPARWSDLCWGEMVSVFLERNWVALNSICDPTRNRPSLVSFGRNARNVHRVKVALEII
jgi:hypothetical protein